MTTASTAAGAVRHLVLILGDQLDTESAALADLDPARDVVCMFEVPYESTRTWSHVARTAVFLSAMRHFAEALKARGIRCNYAQLGRHAHTTIELALKDAVTRHRPQRVKVMVEAGEWQIAQNIAAACTELGACRSILRSTRTSWCRDAFGTVGRQPPATADGTLLPHGSQEHRRPDGYERRARARPLELRR